MIGWEVGGVVAALGFTFGAGRLAEVIKNGKYMTKELHNALHETVCKDISEIKTDLKVVRAHIERKKDHVGEEGY